jgi:hypothetical protein
MRSRRPRDANPHGHDAVRLALELFDRRDNMPPAELAALESLLRRYECGEAMVVDDATYARSRAARLIRHARRIQGSMPQRFETVR